MLSAGFYSNPFATLLSGGVGGARLARGLAAVLHGPELAVVVNVGDDDRMHGVHVAADLDTVVYTLAGIEGSQGWGIEGDTYEVMAALDAMGVDTTFRLGDRDLGHCLWRTERLDAGTPLSGCTTALAAALGVAASILPVTDDPIRTRVRTAEGDWLAFQDYFVARGHRDDVVAIEYSNADRAAPAPGVLESISRARLVLVGPSNPPLSIWPILAVPGIREALAGCGRVVAVSPLFGGKPVKGPADRVMAGLGLPPGTEGVLAAYDGVITDLVVDVGDEADLGLETEATIHTADIRIGDAESGKRFATWLVERFS